MLEILFSLALALAVIFGAFADIDLPPEPDGAGIVMHCVGCIPPECQQPPCS